MPRRGGKWVTLFEDNPGGKLARQVGVKAFQVIEWMDMDDAVGRDNEGQPKYVVDLSYIDIARLSVKQIEDALESCGPGKDEAIPLIGIAESLHGYGLKAPLWSVASNALVRSIREAKREANALLDSEAFTTRMQRPVNRMGSTADEFMRGDMDSAMKRALDPFYGGGRPGGASWAPRAPGHAESREMQPADWLPYLLGYGEGLNGRPREEGNDLVQGYKDGHARGVAVRNGLAKQPSWIK